jgi:hypothetical protein
MGSACCREYSCIDYTSETTCDGNEKDIVGDCVWTGQACRAVGGTVCSNFGNQQQCEKDEGKYGEFGCFWNVEGCESYASITNCSQLNTQDLCETENLAESNPFIYLKDKNSRCIWIMESENDMSRRVCRNSREVQTCGQISDAELCNSTVSVKDGFNCSWVSENCVTSTCDLYDDEDACENANPKGIIDSCAWTKPSSVSVPVCKTTKSVVCDDFSENDLCGDGKRSERHDLENCFFDDGKCRNPNDVLLCGNLKEAENCDGMNTEMYSNLNLNGKMCVYAKVVVGGTETMQCTDSAEISDCWQYVSSFLCSSATIGGTGCFYDSTSNVCKMHECSSYSTIMDCINENNGVSSFVINFPFFFF